MHCNENNFLNSLLTLLTNAFSLSLDSKRENGKLDNKENIKSGVYLLGLP